MAEGDGRLGPLREPAELRTLPARLRAVYEGTGEAERLLLRTWTAFGATFAGCRAVTTTLHRRFGGGQGGIVVRGRHLHHYTFGIALLEAVGAAVIRGETKHVRRPLLASVYGAGSALIMDEVALLVDLADVYWKKDGRVSVDAAVGTFAAGGVLLAAAPFWAGVARELARTRPAALDRSMGLSSASWRSPTRRRSR